MRSIGVVRLLHMLSVMAALAVLAPAPPRVLAAPDPTPATARGPTLSEVIDAYAAYVANQADTFVRETDLLVDAVKAGDLARAKALYARARQPFQRIEPIAGLLGDLVKRVNVRAEEFELREHDPAFIGYHRLEFGLFTEGTTSGLAEVAERLASDSAELRDRIVSGRIPAARAVGSASALIEGIAATRISGEEERYSRTDLWGFQAGIEGSKAIFTLLEPLLRRDPDFVQRVERSYRRVEDVLARYRTPDGGFLAYDRLTQRDRNALKGPITLLAEDLSTLRARVDLD